MQSPFLSIGIIDAFVVILLFGNNSTIVFCNNPFVVSHN